MKKLLVMYVAFGLALLIGVNLYRVIDERTVTDEEMMESYVDQKFGEQCYGELVHTDFDDTHLCFNVYENDIARYSVAVNKDYAHRVYCNE